ncbi:hypothetical protein ACQEVB_08370 [Pseudonocardia sp. CA-107938]|uniref:hypothetical protein n=1 Tax=Pseudonocardia sp. CA-107938 TaxID=3240021 RepID=UPI003D94A9F3
MPVDDLGLRPLSARSVVLSLLLGTHPPELAARALVRGAERLGIADRTLRVALTRMVATGDLVRTGTGYRLADRLVHRQQRQDAALEPATRPWRGRWEIVVVTAVGRPAPDRAELRAELTGLRLAELRDGVWTRPANLRREWPAALTEVTTRFVGQPAGAPAALVEALWDLPGWADRARRLQGRFAATTDLADQVTVAAAIVRHLVADPVLPAALLPAEWPAARLRASYARFRADLPGRLLE